jgi:hypothetical protein
MAEVAPDNSACRRTVVDDLFQVLVARDVPPFIAKEQITANLRTGKLRIDFRIAAGARRMIRPAMPEELGDHPLPPVTRPLGWPEGAPLPGDARRPDIVGTPSGPATYETVGAGGITAAVNPQSWDGGVFALVIEDGRLIIKPRCDLGFPWDAYSFSISNWVVVDQLWPPAASTPTESVADAGRPPVDADKVTWLMWALGQLDRKGKRAGLRGNALLKAACAEVGPKFTASESTFKTAKRRYRESKQLPA